MHPTVIIQAFRQALEDMVAILGDEVGVPVNMDDEAQLIKVRLAIYVTIQSVDLNQEITPEILIKSIKITKKL